MISMDDEKAKAMAGVLGNKACSKIIDCLTEKELSEKDLADALKLPINTVEYNLKKLLKTGLIEKTKNFFWSKKGKKIIMYKISNKSIIISPKSKNTSSKIKSLAIVAGLSGIVAMIIGKANQTILKSSAGSVDLNKVFAVSNGAAEALPQAASVVSITPSIPIWLWFLIGSLFAITMIIILNLRKNK